MNTIELIEELRKALDSFGNLDIVIDQRDFLTGDHALDMVYKHEDSNTLCLVGSPSNCVTNLCGMSGSLEYKK